MKIVLAAIAATFVAGAALSSAVAAPTMARAQLSAESAVEHVQFKKKQQIRKRNFNRGYRAGRRAPSGWRSYKYRPRDYRTRGCIIIGPIWYCP
ncbi:MAG: hypothetical protein ACKVP4_07590 [Hyphomicrobium sp.]